MPQIMVNGIVKELTFNNIVPCKTPGGTPFLTAVDICIESQIRSCEGKLSGPRQEKPSHIIPTNFSRYCVQSYKTR